MTDIDDVDRAIAELGAAVGLGLRLVWVPCGTPAGRAALPVTPNTIGSGLASPSIEFRSCCTWASGPLPIRKEWMNDGRPPTEQMTGAEVISAKDFIAVHHGAQRFLGVLVLDGVLETPRDLRGGAIEIGAGLGARLPAAPRPRRRHLEPLGTLGCATFDRT